MNKRILAAIGVGLAGGAGLFVYVLFSTQCVAEGSLVDTPAGSRRIETLRVGDAVVTDAGEGRIIAVYSGWAMRHLVLRVAGRDLRVTPAHLIATPSGWRPAGSLAVGDEVRAGGWARIESISTRWMPSRVFDLEVEPASCYVAEGVLVHNKTAERSTNERNASATLKWLTTAEADFRANDKDGNGTFDFWVADVRGLYSIKPKADAPEIHLIETSMALADAAPRPNAGGTTYGAAAGPDAPKGGYRFRAFTHYVDHEGKRVAYDDGTGRHKNKFAFAAVPGDGSLKTFIVSEDATIWHKTLNGAALEAYPANPAADGWSKLD